MTASDTTNFHTRLYELLVSGSGVTTSNDPSIRGEYLIPSGSFDAEWWSENRANKAVSLSAAVTPQVRFEFITFDDAKAWAKPASTTMYNFQLAIHVAYWTNSKVLKAQRTNISKKIIDDAHVINKTLTFPTNLKHTDSGRSTGVVGGILQPLNNLSEIVFDYSSQLVTARHVYEGKIVLSNQPLGIPFNLTPPSISGTFEFGETLTLDDGTWENV